VKLVQLFCSSWKCFVFGTYYLLIVVPETSCLSVFIFTKLVLDFVYLKHILFNELVAWWSLFMILVTCWFSLSDSCILIFLLLRLILFKERFVWIFVNGTYCMLIFVGETFWTLINLLVKLAHFFLLLDFFCSWNMLCTKFFSWNWLRANFFRETYRMLVFLFVKLVCWLFFS